ncbi:hypothetical protein [Streptomyces sp. S1]|uniref:hypothetical protein n=1 Tax=Streptomyces sp. S1 TaxID=718288 RepID=UPI000EF7F86E|nr:hypothetical protein [Streptomyces sp. S1]
MTVGDLRRVLDLHGTADDLPVEVHADVLGGEFVSVLRLESVHFSSNIPEGTAREEGALLPAGHGHVTRVVLGAGLGSGRYVRKNSLFSAKG